MTAPPVSRHTSRKRAGRKSACGEKLAFNSPLWRCCRSTAAHSEADVNFTLEQFESAVAAIW